VVLVVPGDGKVADGARKIMASSGVWSTASISSCDGGGARLEVERAAGASGDEIRHRFPAI
jgi:hypothetical protein